MARFDLTDFAWSVIDPLLLLRLLLTAFDGCKTRQSKQLQARKRFLARRRAMAEEGPAAPGMYSLFRTYGTSDP